MLQIRLLKIAAHVEVLKNMTIFPLHLLIYDKQVLLTVAGTQSGSHLYFYIDFSPSFNKILKSPSFPECVFHLLYLLLNIKLVCLKYASNSSRVIFHCLQYQDFIC